MAVSVASLPAARSREVATTRVGWTYFILAACAAVAARHVYYWHEERWDDAYITFRIVDHLAAGHGLVWNVGGDRVEGFSSLAHVLLITPLTLAGVSPWLSTLCLGVAATAVTITVMLRIVLDTAGRIAAAAVPIGLYLADEITAVHVGSGLETQVFVAALALCYRAALIFAVAASPRAALSLSAASLFAVLTRPEAVLYVGATYLVLAIHAIRCGDRQRWRMLAAATFVLAAAGAAYAGWKLWYFGYLMPNPYYVKSARLSLIGGLEVLAFIWHLISRHGIALVLLAIVVGREWRRWMAACAAESVAFPVLLAVVPAVVALLYYTTIFHEMGEFYRFSYPTYFHFIAAGGIVAALGAQTVPRRTTTIAALAIAYTAVVLAIDRPWNIASRGLSEYAKHFSRIGDALQSTALGARGRLLCDVAGRVPYSSGFTHVDRVGLVDNVLSGRTPMTPDQREAYMFGRPLDVYLGYEPPAGDGARGPEDDPRLQGTYAAALLRPRVGVVAERILPRDPTLLHRRMRELRDHWIWIGDLGLPHYESHGLRMYGYVRRDSPHRSILIEALGRIVVRSAADAAADLR